MSEENTPERRRFSRITIDGVGRLHCDGEVWEGRLLDISLKGVLVERPPEWDRAPGTRCGLELLPGDGGIVIEMDATVVHSEADHLGIRWDQIDVDSAAHLKRLLELNLADEGLMERELAELAG